MNPACEVQGAYVLRISLKRCLNFILCLVEIAGLKVSNSQINARRRPGWRGLHGSGKQIDSFGVLLVRNPQVP